MYRLKILDQDLEELKSLVFSAMPAEAGAFALAGVSKQTDRTDVLVRRPVAVPESLFLVQREERLEVAAKAINGLAALCEANSLGAVICHSHPGPSKYSPSDDHGERRIFNALGQMLPSKAPLASLLLYPGGLTGRVWEPSKRRFVPISEVVVVGRSLTQIGCTPMTESCDDSSRALFDRQVQAFGEEGQIRLSRTRVGIVGVGGTGSAVAEQLARIGVQDFALVDCDSFSASNVTRMYGTFSSKKRRWWWPYSDNQSKGRKVDIIAQHLTHIGSNVRVRTMFDSVVVDVGARTLLDRDVIFLCTDEHWGRAIVNEIAYQYMIPTINLGMSIRTKDGSIATAAGGVDVLRPGNACLWCSQFLSADRIAAESIPVAERRSRLLDGYVEDIDTPAPSVISITTTLAGLAVTQFLQLVTDFMGENGDICRLRYNILDGTVRRGQTRIMSDCICGKVKGFGNLRPLSTLACLPELGSER